MIASLQLYVGSASDILVRKLMEEGKPFPLRIEGTWVSWAHAIVERRACADGVATYDIRKVAVCLCGKPIHPLPFECDNCMTVSWKLDTYTVTYDPKE
jgi:hypothetical protein